MTILDRYGREIVVTQADGFDVYSVGDGMELTLLAGWPQDQALATIEAMMPPGAASLHSAPVLSCSDLQFRLALNQLGLRAAVEAYVASAPQDVRDWWERATIIHADNAMLIEAATALGKTQADIDAAITLGKTLA